MYYLYEEKIYTSSDAPKGAVLVTSKPGDRWTPEQEYVASNFPLDEAALYLNRKKGAIKARLNKLQPFWNEERAEILRKLWPDIAAAAAVLGRTELSIKYKAAAMGLHDGIGLAVKSNIWTEQEIEALNSCTTLADVEALQINRSMSARLAKRKQQPLPPSVLEKLDRNKDKICSPELIEVFAKITQ
jgi:hypothetical protein